MSHPKEAIRPDALTILLNPYWDVLMPAFQPEIKEALADRASRCLLNAYSAHFNVEQTGTSLFSYGSTSIIPIGQSIDLQFFFEGVMNDFESEITQTMKAKTVLSVMVRLSTALFHTYKQYLKERDTGDTSFTCFGRSLMPYKGGSDTCDLRQLFKDAMNMFWRNL